MKLFRNSNAPESQENTPVSGGTTQKGLRAFLSGILHSEKPPIEIAGFLSLKRPRTAVGILISVLLLLLTVSHTGLFLHDSSLNHHLGIVFLALSILVSLLSGLIIAPTVRFTDKIGKIYSFAMYLAAPFFAALLTECIQGIFIYKWSVQTFLLNYLLFLVLYSVTAVFTGGFRRTILITTPILSLFSFASMLIKTFRGTPLMPADFATISTGLAVASEYHYKLTCTMILAINLLILFEALAFQMPKLKLRRQFHHLFRLLSLLLILGACLPFYLTSIAADHGIKPDFWNQARGYKNTGTIFNFILNTRYLIVEKPDQYQASEVPPLITDQIASAGEDPGIFASAQDMQKKQQESSDSGEASVADTADSAATIENTGTLEDLNQEEEKNTVPKLTALAYENPVSSAAQSDPDVPELPNTGTDTKLAVQYTSDTEQPAVSAVLKEGEFPDIIVIMNETFSDLRVLGELSTNKDYLPFLRNLTKNTIKGNLYLPVTGAGTSNSEFEFLTGNSMAFLPGGSNAYELYIKSKLPSLAQTLGDQGYSRTAYHTYYKKSWKRNINYPLLGFESFFALEDILDTETVEAYRDGEISLFEYEQKISFLYPDDKILLRRFVSDSFDYKELERMYEARNPDQPFFLFNVTMQNHGSYDLAYSNFDQQIQITSEEKFYPKANRYLSLIYESDKALKELIDYFSNTSRPVMVVLFGDHQPAVEEEFVESLLGTRLTNATVSQNQKRFATPFMIWTNYSSQSGYIEKMSANYLSTLILQQAGLQMTDYNRYLSSMYQKLPVIDTTGYITADNKYYTYDDDTEYTPLLDGYDKIIYNFMFDQLNRDREHFCLPASQSSTEEN